LAKSLFLRASGAFTGPIENEPSNVGCQVYLRRRQPKLISDDELECVRRQVAQPRKGSRYKVEMRGEVLTVHESTNDFSFMREFAPHLSAGAREDINECFAHYQPVLRFILVDAEQRLFAPERYCFRGRVDDWISIGAPESIGKLAAKYLKHLGSDSIYELF
jgi:hypothetical protein